MRRKIRNNRHHLHAIEYIGPRPQKPARRPWGGGWLMVLLVVVVVGYISRPFIGKLMAHAEPITELKVEQTVAWLNSDQDGFGRQLAAIALERTHQKINYDQAYYNIDYPNGDIPPHKGCAPDLIIRSYRALGVDLQQLVHEDMVKNFRIYPQLWGATQPDPNIDHRRVENLQRFFSRFGQDIKIPADGVKMQDFDWGDIVVWRLPDGTAHIGIIVPGPDKRKEERWVVHNKDSGPVWEDALLEYKVIGHYRYSGPKPKTTAYLNDNSLNKN